MVQSLTAILPVFLLLALGWWFRRRTFPGDEFWARLDPLVYYVLLPALLLHNFATVELASLAVLPTGAAVVLAIAVMTGLLLLARAWLPIDGPAFTSLLQTGVRFNSYLSFAIAAQLFGGAGLTLFSLVVAFATPAANVVSVSGLMRWGESGGGRRPRLAWALASNPLILSILGGVALNLGGIGLPWVAEPFFDVLGRAALPLGLLAAGAGLDMRALLGGAGGMVALACGLRLLAMPALMLATTALFGVEGMTRTCVLIYAVVPAPPGAYILARQLGGNDRLMAAIIAASTLAAILTVPAWLALLA